MGKKKTTGITIFGIFYLLGGIISSIATLGALFSYLYFKNNPVSGFTVNFPSWYLPYLLVVLMMGIGGVLISIGILKLLPWARLGIIVLAVLGILGTFISKPSVRYNKVATVKVEPGEDMSQTQTRLAEEMKRITPPSKKVTQSFNVVNYILPIMFIIFYFGTIFYFTQSKVKERFR